MEGWIKLHRSLLDWEWYDDNNTFRLFMHLLLNANYEKKRWHGTEIMPGQIVTSLGNLSESTGLTVQNVRTSINKLKTTGEITIKSTNKFSILTLCNWEQYQSIEDAINKPTNKQTNKPTTNKQQTTNKQLTTTKEGKKDKKERKEEKTEVMPDKPAVKPDFIDQLFEVFCQEYEDVYGYPFKTLTKEKERKAIGKLLVKYKQNNRGADSQQTLNGMRAGFRNCMRVNNGWIQENMSPTIIVSKYDVILKILRNGNKSAKRGNGVTDRELAEIIAKHFAVDSS